jgi:ABC-2 type transport system permease protein
VNHVLGWRALRAGQRARALLWRRRLRSQTQLGVGRMLFLLVTALCLITTIFGVCYGAAWYVRSKDAAELLSSGFSTGFLFVAGALVFSSLGHAAQAFFSAQDLWWWDSAPAPSWVLFIDRGTETALAAAPASMALAGAALLGGALGADLGASGCARVLLAMFTIVPLPICLGIALAHLGGAILPAGRLRRVALLFVGLFITAGLVWLRQQRIERLLTPEGAQELLQRAQSTSSSSSWWPHHALAEFVVHASWSSWCVAAAAACACMFMTWALHHGLYRRARALAADESPAGLAPGGRVERWLVGLLRGLPAALRSLVKKDVLGFIRDPGQWGQLVLLAGVGLLYVINASVMRQGFAGQAHAAATLLVGLHVGVVSFIASGLCVRFAFPQVGLEGAALWLWESSPRSARMLLQAKWMFTVPIVVGLPTLTALMGGIAMQLDSEVLLATTALVGAVALGMAALAVGKGAVRPVLDASSLSELAMGPGAISTMMVAMVIAFITAVCTTIAATAWRLCTTDLAERTGMGQVPVGSAVGIALTSLALPVGISWVLGWRAMRAGEQGLQRRRIDGVHTSVASSQIAAGPETT